MPTDNGFMDTSSIKEEPLNYELDESEFDANNFVETKMAQEYPDVKPNVLKKSKKKKRLKKEDYQSEEFKETKRFNCDICGKSYINLSNLQGHIAIAHEGKTFNCDYCEKIFKSKDGLQLHVTGMDYSITGHGTPMILILEVGIPGPKL